MLETIHSLSMLTLMEIIGPILLLAALVYGTWQWSRRRRSSELQRARDRATRRNYAQPEDEGPRSRLPPLPASRPAPRLATGGWIAMIGLLVLVVSGLAWLASSPPAVVPETTGQGPAASPPATNR
jgi:hypothetical protein